MAGSKLAKAADNWASGVGRSGGAWTDGVGSVTESPTQGALRAKQKMMTAWQESMNNGTFDAGCNRVTAASWKQSCQNKSGNYTQAAQTKKAKYASYIQAAQGAIQQIQATAKGMPSDTLEQRIERSAYVQREMAKLRGKYRAN